MKVLSFGSLNIDYTYQVDHIVQRGETIHSGGLALHAGGKGLNQAIALAKAGADVYHAGSVGTDGSFLLEELQAAGVHTEMQTAGTRTELVRVLSDIRTGNAIIQNDSGGDNAIVLFGGANQAIESSQIDETVSRFAPGDFLVMQNEINRMPELMECAHAHGMKLVLNPAPMTQDVITFPLSFVDYLVVNEIEAGQLLEMSGDKKAASGSYRLPEDMEEMAQALQKAYPESAVILTCGAHGAVYADAGKCFLQGSYPCRAVDTTAAGDM